MHLKYETEKAAPHFSARKKKLLKYSVSKIFSFSFFHLLVPLDTFDACYLSCICFALVADDESNLPFKLGQN